MKKITIIQSSLRDGSHTHILCQKTKEVFESQGIQVDYVDLRDIEMEFCNGQKLEAYNSDLQDVYQRMEQSEGVIFGMPVYQYTMSGVLKNLIDICGGALQSKPVGVLVNAGGPNCYMASRDLFDALYFEYQTRNIAPTPYTWSMDFKDGEIVNEKVLQNRGTRKSSFRVITFRNFLSPLSELGMRVCYQVFLLISYPHSLQCLL
ncbi:NAD(P)H-dependent oxidoreductase [Candidatus Gracilibacteria bacterium]|nr:NAD(P)H-dependent oxidoreductase [Candidatus Gracilibacteria bacterium]